MEDLLTEPEASASSDACQEGQTIRKLEEEHLPLELGASRYLVRSRRVALEYARLPGVPLCLLASDRMLSLGMLCCAFKQEPRRESCCAASLLHL